MYLHLIRPSCLSVHLHIQLILWRHWMSVTHEAAQLQHKSQTQQATTKTTTSGTSRTFGNTLNKNKEKTYKTNLMPNLTFFFLYFRFYLYFPFSRFSCSEWETVATASPFRIIFSRLAVMHFCALLFFRSCPTFYLPHAFILKFHPGKQLCTIKAFFWGSVSRMFL